MEIGGMKYELDLFGVTVPSLMLWGGASTSATRRTGSFLSGTIPRGQLPAFADRVQRARRIRGKRRRRC
jgi:hypothetical protein